MLRTGNESKRIKQSSFEEEEEEVGVVAVVVVIASVFSHESFSVAG